MDDMSWTALGVVSAIGTAIGTAIWRAGSKLGHVETKVDHISKRIDANGGVPVRCQEHESGMTAIGVRVDGIEGYVVELKDTAADVAESARRARKLDDKVEKLVDFVEAARLTAERNVEKARRIKAAAEAEAEAEEK